MNTLIRNLHSGVLDMTTLGHVGNSAGGTGNGDIADELYALPPADFITRRDAAAKELSAAGNRPAAAALKTLKKPTQAGWALNLLARHAGSELTDLVDVGAALRSAQEQLSGPQLRELSQQRQAVVRALTQRARQLAREHGQALTEPVAEQVRRSLDAALTDPGLGQALLRGRNTGVLEYATGGFGPAAFKLVPGGGGSAPSTPKVDQPAAPSAEDIRRHKQEQAAALRRLRKAVADARRTHTARVKKRADIEKALEAAHLRVAAAQEALNAALADEEDIETKLESAQTAESEAAEALQYAEADLDE